MSYKVFPGKKSGREETCAALSTFRRNSFLLLQKAIGSGLKERYQELLLLEKKSHDEVAKIHHDRLRATLLHASSSVPFYRTRVPSSPWGDLQGFPIVSRAAIQEDPFSFMPDEFRITYREHKAREWGYGWSLVHTGGSTGAPITVVQDRDFADRMRAARMYFQHLCEFPFGVPYFYLWGSMYELEHRRKGLRPRATALLAGEEHLNGFHMEDSHMRTYVRLIHESGIRHMIAYVDAAVALARYSAENNSGPPPLSSIMTTSGSLMPSDRALLSSVLAVRVHNKYGSRDCGEIACECEEGKLHVLSPGVHLEVVDSLGSPVPHGREGRILVTCLSNRCFPLIRYDIGDVGILSEDQCLCGRPFPLLDAVLGRAAEYLTSASGGFVSPVYIRQLIGVAHKRDFIRRYQIIQRTKTAFSLFLEVTDNADATSVHEVVSSICIDLRRVLGSISLDTHIVNRIPPTPSGKFLYSVNHFSRYCGPDPAHSG